MSDKITYAKAGGPPHDWYGLRIFDLDTGAETKKVIEVNAEDGWLLRYKTDAAGDYVLNFDKGEIETEKLTGHFEIRRPASC